MSTRKSWNVNNYYFILYLQPLHFGMALALSVLALLTSLVIWH